MLFTTLTFLLFLPVVLAAYWLLPRQSGRNAVIVAASYFFYGWWDVRYAVLMAAASLVDFLVALALERTEAPRRRKLVLAASCACQLGLLSYFKYAGFFMDNAQALASFDLFASIYGAVAGDYALARMARGGVFLAGGVAGANRALMQRGPFIAAFNAKGVHSRLAASMPVSIVTEPLLGLYGAARLA